MKRLSTIIMALVLALGLTQCKKNEPNTTVNFTNISLSIKTNSAKVDVNTITGLVDFETGDQIQVASAGKYVGTLTYNGTAFVGAIGNATEGQPLQFYFLGNITPAETLNYGATESCSVVITDQTEHLPVISAAMSEENFYGEVTDYTAELKNKCALVKFNVTTSSEAATCVTGFNNKVTVNFMDNTITNSQEGEGVITLPSGNGEQWAILLPQEAMGYGNAYSADEAYTGTCGTVPAIYVNGYFPAGISVEVTTAAGQGGGVPEGVLSGLFSVNDTLQVRFSQGNLQYIGSAGNGDDNNTGAYWKFAEHQWDCLGDNGQVSTSKTVDRDLFCWGTSGYNHGSTAYQPWRITQYNSYYRAYGSATKNLYDAKNDGSMQGQADWGYNAIANGGNMENSGWRTLTNDEWGYIFNNRTDADSKWGQGKVNDMNGMILLPDNWTLPEGLTFIPGQRESEEWDFDSLVYNAEQWAQMESNGAVFLPAAGYNAYNVTSIGNTMNGEGTYWSSSYFNSNYAYQVQFFCDYLDPQRGWHRLHAGSVRLVRNAE